MLVFTEVCAYLFFHYTKDRFTFYHFDNYLLDEGRITDLKRGYDRDLGWTTLYKTSYGQRPMPSRFDTDLMSAFGDSFTHCDQVEDHQTWENYLAQYTEANVYNFGVGGYGTDQAYLRYQRISKKLVTPITTLALIGENICRAVNVYRKFYFPRTGGPLTKPRFVQTESGDLRLLPNPVRSADEIKKLTDPMFLHKIGRNDYWYNHEGYPEFSFPYTFIFFNKYFWIETGFFGDTNIDDMVPRPLGRVLLWKSEHASIMFGIFDRFVKEVKATRSVPVIMAIPTIDNLLHRLRNGKNPENFQIMERYAISNGYRFFNALDALMKNVDDEQEARSLFNGHLSDKGNRAVAAGFYNYLKQEKLLPLTGTGMYRHFSPN